MSSCIRYATAAGIIDDMKLYVCTCIYMRVCGVCVHACVHTTEAGIIGDMKLYICMFECAYMRACVCVCVLLQLVVHVIWNSMRARACVCMRARACVSMWWGACMNVQHVCLHARLYICVSKRARKRKNFTSDYYYNYYNYNFKEEFILCILFHFLRRYYSAHTDMEVQG